MAAVVVVTDIVVVANVAVEDTVDIDMVAVAVLDVAEDVAEDVVEDAVDPVLMLHLVVVVLSVVVVVLAVDTAAIKVKDEVAVFEDVPGARRARKR